jgi:hypothetical protein
MLGYIEGGESAFRHGMVDQGTTGGLERKEEEKRETQPIVDCSNQLKVVFACHTRNRSIFFHYCIKGLYIAAFWAFQFATTIAEVEGFCPNRYTPICGVERKRSRAISDHASLFGPFTGEEIRMKKASCPFHPDKPT